MEAVLTFIGKAGLLAGLVLMSLYCSGQAFKIYRDRSRAGQPAHDWFYRWPDWTKIEDLEARDQFFDKTLGLVKRFGLAGLVGGSAASLAAIATMLPI